MSKRCSTRSENVSKGGGGRPGEGGPGDGSGNGGSVQQMQESSGEQDQEYKGSIWEQISDFFGKVGEGFINNLNDGFLIGADGIPYMDKTSPYWDDLSNAMIGGLMGTPSGGSGINSLKSLVSSLKDGIIVGQELLSLIKKWNVNDIKGLIGVIDGAISGLGKVEKVKGKWTSPLKDSLYKKVGRFKSSWGGAPISANGLTNGKVLIITGSRDYMNKEKIRSVLEGMIKSGSTPSYVVHGGARGADNLVEQVCKDLKIPTKVYAISDAQWTSIGKVAGHERNSQMLWDTVKDVGKDRMTSVSFFDGIVTPGTADMTKKLILAGVDGVTVGVTPTQFTKWTNTWVDTIK